jgi:dTDP-4-amino-4,6-dideoxygalactose transaminase
MAIPASAASVDPVPVPPLNLAAQFAALREELLGEMAAAFEEALAHYCGVKHALGLSSGTDALLVALMALEVGPGDEVIVPTFTFFGTAGTVARLGARPVFCDIAPQTFNIDVGQVERRLTPRTKAIIPVHLYGQLADVDPLLAIAERHGVPVVEDVAQAIGAKLANGRMAGSLGFMGALSFYPTKNLGALGDAGALLTSDDRMIELARQLRVHGSGHTYYHDRVGGNFRIDALQAALLAIKLKYLETWTEQRRARAARYTELFVAARLAPEHVRPPQEIHGRHVYHQYVLRADRRDELVAFLKARQIGAGVYYPLPLHLQECFAGLGHRPGDFPHAEKAAAEVVALPMYPELTDAQQQSVVAGVAEFYRGPQ